MSEAVALIEDTEPDGAETYPEDPASDDGLQPRRSDEEALEELEGQDERVRLAADQLRRRAVDSEIYRLLRKADFEGPVWEQYAEAMAEYGYAVFHAWVGTGLVFARCAEAGIGLAGSPSLWTVEDRADLVQDTVAGGLFSFRRSLQRGLWDPLLGASLKTFYVGACKYAFANAFRAWRRALQRGALEEDFMVRLVSRDQSPETAVLDRQLAETALAEMGSTNAALVRLKAAEYSNTEIAELLGITVGAVEQRWHRHCRRRDAPGPRSATDEGRVRR